jgi:glycosyl transferase family 25
MPNINTPVFLVTFKESKRQKIIKEKLNSLKIKYKIFYAIGGEDPNNFKTLDKLCDHNITKKITGKRLKYTAISNAECHLRIYKYIVKNNINNAVIMEDDCHPSKILLRWLKLKNLFKDKKYDLIHIYHNFGLVFKNSSQFLDNKFLLYKTCYTLPYTTCYQISKRACNYILKKNKKISLGSDWPVNFYKTNLKQFAVLPYIASVVYNHEDTSYSKNQWRKFYLIAKIKKFIPFYNILTALYFILHIPFILRNYKNYEYYKENFLLRKIFYIKSLFSNNYINLQAATKNNFYYPLDLLENFKKQIKVI